MPTISPDHRGRANLGKWLAPGETWSVEVPEPGQIVLKRLEPAKRKSFLGSAAKSGVKTPVSSDPIPDSEWDGDTAGL